MMWSTTPLTLVNGVIVGRDGLASTLRVRGRTIDRLDAVPRLGDAVIDLEGAIVFPGLINAHDHLELNSFPRLKWRARYDNVRRWIADFQPRFATDPDLAIARADTLDERLWVGGLKNLLSGVTTVCHHNPLHAALRRQFPIKVVTRFGWSHSLQIDGAQVAAARRATPSEWPWIIHAAEGVDDEARREADTLGDMGCLGGNTVLVHGVALTPAQTARVLETGGALVWCPTSNDFLLGRTADVRRFSAQRRLGLGTDSRLSGAGHLLDELRAANLEAQIPADALARAVTRDAADLLRLPTAGRLAPGAPADLTVIRRLTADPFETLVNAQRVDVRLTMIDGAPLVADESLAHVFDLLNQRSRRVAIDDAPRALASWIAARLDSMTLAEPGLRLS